MQVVLELQGHNKVQMFPEAVRCTNVIVRKFNRNRAPHNKACAKIQFFLWLSTFKGDAKTESVTPHENSQMTFE